jgi:hypothetical protein
MMTDHAGIFAGGDMVPSERTVTAAVGHGKKAARHIDAWLRGSEYRPPAKHPIVSFDLLCTCRSIAMPSAANSRCCRPLRVRPILPR